MAVSSFTESFSRQVLLLMIVLSVVCGVSCGFDGDSGGTQGGVLQISITAPDTAETYTLAGSAANILIGARSPNPRTGRWRTMAATAWASAV